MANDHMNLHESCDVEVNGSTVQVDRGIADLVCWMNQFSGVETFTSCQGGSDCCSPDAFVGFSCESPTSRQEIERQLEVGRVSEHNGNYTLELSVQELKSVNEKLFRDSTRWQEAK